MLREATTKTAKGVDGLLLVDKPAGVSSHDVVNVARRRFGERRIGHAGTLDPFATGLLVLLLGRTTRLAQYVNDEPKEYVGDIRFGAETETEDLLGAVTREAARPTADALRSIAGTFVGRISQVPPAYSAKRVDGKRAYEIARSGAEVALKAVDVQVHSLSFETFTEEGGRVSSCRIRVACGGGTYIRSLARDIARSVGSAAHLTSLRRERAGVFSLGRSIPLERLREGEGTLAPPIDALEGYPVQPLSDDEVARVARGIDVEARVDGKFAALIESRGSGDLVAFGERRPSERGDRWQPRVVMRGES
jgi:tRNA pseudouridine55 synthase